MRVRVVGWSVVVLLTVARPSAAQGAGDVGVTVGYPGAVGVLWQITDGIAVRPDFSIVKTRAEGASTVTLALPPGLTITPSTSTSEGWGSTTGLSLLVTVRTIDELRLYLAPRIGYTRSTTESESSGGSFGNSTAASASSESKATGWLAAGSFGADYRAHDRFAVFGELGVQYQTQTSTSTFSNTRSESEATQVGLRSAVGVTIYF